MTKTTTNLNRIPPLKFSHDYMKLPLDWNGTQAVLMQITNKVDMDELKLSNPAFIKYDTKFRGEEGSYELDFKWGMILFPIHLNTGLPFTTIRRWTPRSGSITLRLSIRLFSS